MANTNKQLVKDQRFWEIRNGEEADFFRDSWQQLPKIQDEVALPHLQALLEREGLIRVKDF